MKQWLERKKSSISGLIYWVRWQEDDNANRKFTILYEEPKELLNRKDLPIIIEE